MQQLRSTPPGTDRRSGVGAGGLRCKGKGTPRPGDPAECRKPARPPRPPPPTPHPPRGQAEASFEPALRFEVPDGPGGKRIPRPAPSPHLDKHAPPARPPAPDRRAGGRDGRPPGRRGWAAAHFKAPAAAGGRGPNQARLPPPRHLLRVSAPWGRGGGMEGHRHRPAPPDITPAFLHPLIPARCQALCPAEEHPRFFRSFA